MGVRQGAGVSPQKPAGSAASGAGQGPGGGPAPRARPVAGQIIEGEQRIAVERQLARPFQIHPGNADIAQHMIVKILQPGQFVSAPQIGQPVEQSRHYTGALDIGH